MKLTKTELYDIIVEEIASLIEGGPGSGSLLTKAQIRARDRQRDNADIARRRKDSMMGGLRSLAHGIAEDDAEDGCVGNHNHGEDGRWTNPEDAASWTRLDKSCKKHGQYQKKYKGPSSAPCGTQGPKRCKDATLKEDPSEKKYLDLLYKYEKLEAKFNQAVNQLMALRKKATGKGMTFDQCVKTINNVVASTKGDLTKKVSK